jgi:hypothetical protein
MINVLMLHRYLPNSKDEVYPKLEIPLKTKTYVLITPLKTIATQLKESIEEGLIPFL